MCNRIFQNKTPRRCNTQNAVGRQIDLGFTLLELIVTISIFTIITSVVLINYPLFGEQLGVDLRAQDIALLARQAQVFALGVRGTTFAQAPEFERGVFGIYVNATENDQVRFFADRNTIDRLYNEQKGECGTTDTECIEVFKLTRGYYISDICVKRAGLSPECGVQELHISYQRPLPEAQITVDGFLQYSLADIVIRSPRTDVAKKVVIYTSGQITVQDI